MRTSAFVFCLLILLSRTLSAGVTGKLSGVIRDAGTEEPLVGANVILVGTALGAATDASGFYFVNNVPPGVYSVRVTLIGYRPLLLNDVRIMVDVTTELDGALTDEAVELGVVEITAERSIVQKDLTSTRTIVDGDIIVKDLRFQDINEVLQLQAGVVRGTDGQLHVRGGRAGGTLYQVDGIPLQNPFDRSQAGEVEVERVQELQTLLGTFDAEYGNASDGVVTVYTKDGGEKYAGRVFYQSPRLNSSPYQVPDWNLDRPEVQALPPDQQQEYLDEVRKPDGSSAYEYANVLDDPYAQDYLLINALGTWTANLSGPVPFLSPLTFFITGRLVQENGYLPFGYNILQSATAKLTYPLSSVLTLRGSGDWAAGYRQFYNHQYKYWRWWDSGLDTLGREGGFPINENHNNRQLLSIRHVLSQSTFYDLSLARVYENSSQVVPDRTVVSDPATGELIASDYEQRQWVGGNDSGFRYGDVRYWVNTKTTQYIVKGNIESQVHPSHQLRAGVEVNFNEIFRHRIGMPTRPNLEYFTY
ncbi:MAG: TonB-dependent receptor, partial [Bacteroidota bacterium]